LLRLEPPLQKKNFFSVSVGFQASRKLKRVYVFFTSKLPKHSQ